MIVVQGTVNNVREIATIYSQAFPASVDFFFPNKPQEKLLELLELSFMLVFFWGGRATIAKTNKGQIDGYCLYLTEKERCHRDYKSLLQYAPRLITKVKLCELKLLVLNQFLLNSTRRLVAKPAKSRAQIVSIAVKPEFQGQGLGKALLVETLNQLEGQYITLNVRKNNLTAKTLYKKVGFKEYGRTKDLTGEWICLQKEP